ncbi:MAG: hypothetical protein R2710_16095 [Acidimicrobiales bacterium]
MAAIPAGDIAFEAPVFLSGLTDEIDLDAERARITKVIDQDHTDQGFRGQARQCWLRQQRQARTGGRDHRETLAAAQADRRRPERSRRTGRRVNERATETIRSASPDLTSPASPPG